MKTLLLKRIVGEAKVRSAIELRCLPLDCGDAQVMQYMFTQGFDTAAIALRLRLPESVVYNSLHVKRELARRLKDTEVA